MFTDLSADAIDIIHGFLPQEARHSLQGTCFRMWSLLLSDPASIPRHFIVTNNRRVMEYLIGNFPIDTILSLPVDCPRVLDMALNQGLYDDALAVVRKQMADTYVQFGNSLALIAGKAGYRVTAAVIKDFDNGRVMQLFERALRAADIDVLDTFYATGRIVLAERHLRMVVDSCHSQAIAWLIKKGCPCDAAMLRDLIDGDSNIADMLRQ